MSSKRILIVEDDSIIGWHLERSLTDLGYRVIGVLDNGESVVAAAARDAPDVVLMDIGLKGRMDGIDTAWILRHQLDIPVIYLTAYTDSATLERAKQTEPYGYLRKPFDEQAMRATIEMALYNHRLKRQLMESEQRYRMLFSTLQEAFALHEIILDEHGMPVDYRFLDVNPAFEHMTGMQAGDVIGKTVKEVLPDTEEKWVQIYGQVAITGTPASFEDYTEALQKYFRVTAFSPHPGQFATLFYDITKTKELEGTLRANEERLRMLTAAASCYILEIDADRVIRFANKPLPGYTIDQMAGMRLETWIPPELQKNIPELVARAFEEKQEQVMLVTLPEEGILHTYLVQLTPVLSGPGAQTAVLTATDISEQEQAKQALSLERAMLARRVEESTADLRIANAQLARAAQMKDEFLASMSHELRTPMTGILGLTEALRKNYYGEVTGRQETALRNVEESGMHLLSLINEILDLSKIEAGRLDLELRPGALGSVCEACLRMVREAAQKKGIEILSQVDPELQYLMLDERRLKQILVNLLSNAIKFSPPNGRVDLQIQLDCERQVYEISVTDRGIGIKREDLPRLFQPFVQLEGGLSKPFQGTGLGLSLVMRLAELHGGGVSVESEFEQGSRFCVRLPYYPVSLTDYEDWYLNAAAAPGSRRQKHSALVLEDSPGSASRLAKMVDFSLDFQTWNAEEDPCELAARVRPELIFLNVVLPGCSGWDVLSRLRTDERTRDIPVIVVSETDERLRGLANGAAAYLVKPVSDQQVWEVVRKVLRGREHFNAPPAAATDRLAGMEVLLAEDNDLNLNTLTDYLVFHGCRVIPAHNGTEAIELLHEHCPDVVLMDIQMPVMDGMEAIRKIRSSRICVDLPIIALTALAMPGDRERCLQAGANDYLSKPVRFDRLGEVILKVAGRI